MAPAIVTSEHPTKSHIMNQPGNMCDANSADMISADMNNADGAVAKQLSDVLQTYWGFDSFRPLQLDAMKSVMRDQDSLVVFPTGGGKSLCFQAPAVCRDGLAVVVSPLISLMKDQVDALRACGIPAECLNSSITNQDQRRVLELIKKGELRLLYVAPERLLMKQTFELLKSANVSFFAIDEAHCVSEWGHDFRPDYRGLSQLKREFPSVAIHAYTATATEQVRADIVRQLNLKEPQTLIGAMDRPNLTYRIRRRSGGVSQIAEVLQQHKGESGIVYCISRKDVEGTSAALNAMGFSTAPYHAGMSDQDRKRNQEAFLREQIDTIVATVAFGMGIDKSNVRYVVHAAMPKSLEGYQQESGRAGRDGLEAECWLFHSGTDVVTWRRIISQSESAQGREGAMQSLNAISDFCNSVTCRHVSLSSHFGQTLAECDCGACDVCLSELDLVDDALIIGQKILSCVMRVDQRFGSEYVAQVLTGSQDKRILQNKHDQLSTYGLMAETDKRTIRNWIDQLVSQAFLVKFGEYNVLQVSDPGRQLLRGELTPRLTKPTESFATLRSDVSNHSWEGVDRGLFEKLKELRSATSTKNAVPAYVIFSDASLRDMARRRPSSANGFRAVHGVADQKLKDFGDLFLPAIRQYCEAGNLNMDVRPPASVPLAQPITNKSVTDAFPFFDDGKSVADVAKLMNRAESTTRGYLQNYIQSRQITDATRWVEESKIDGIRNAILEHGIGPLKPIFVALDEKVSYDDIRVVMACMKNETGASSTDANEYAN